MPLNATTYNPRRSVVHDVDARVKILLVMAYSITLFCVHSWWGIGLLALLAAAACAAARLDVRAAARVLLPVAVLLFVTLVANAFVFDVRSYDAEAAPGAVSVGIFGEMPPVPLIGAFGFVPAGFVRGCFYVVRIVLLVAASLVLTTTSSSTELTGALKSFMRPLAAFGLPTHDVATVLSIALRFIPVTVDEFELVRRAQASRGAPFDTGGLLVRLKAWASVLVPLFVGLFRRAEALSLAMDARCYGSAPATELTCTRITLGQALLLAAGIAVCVALSLFG